MNRTGYGALDGVEAVRAWESFELGFNNRHVLGALRWRGLVAPNLDRFLNGDFELVHQPGISTLLIKNAPEATTYLGRCSGLIAQLNERSASITWQHWRINPPRIYPSFSVVYWRIGGALQGNPQRRHVVVGVEVVYACSAWWQSVTRHDVTNSLETHVASNEFAYTAKTSSGKIKSQNDKNIYPHLLIKK